MAPRTFGGVDADGAVDAAFWAWATSNGVEAIRCAPGEVSEGWRGVVATGDIAADDVILRVPGELLMSARSAARDPDLVAAFENVPPPGLTPADRLCCHLLREAARGVASPWHLYVAQLPRAYNILACWSDAERAELQVPHAVDAAARAAEEVRAARRRAAPALDALALPRAFRSERAWAWAHATVSSRTVFVPFDPAGALCPVGDLFNYAPPPPAHAPTFLGTPLEGGDEEETRDRVRPGDDEEPDQKPAGDGAWDEASGEYRFHARRAYRAGDQIMLCYGRYTNLELLEHYGFLLPPVPGNPNDVAEFPLVSARRHPGDGDGDGDKNGDVSTPRVRALPNGQLEWDDLRDVRVRGWEATRGAPRRETREAASRGHALGAAAEEAAFAALVDAAAAELLGLPTTAREDTAEMQRAIMRRSSDDGRSGESSREEHDERRQSAATEEIDRCLDPDGAPSEWTEEEGRDAEEAAARAARTAEDPDGNASLALRWRLAHKRATQAAYRAAEARVEETRGAKGEGGKGGVGEMKVSRPRVGRR